ncbi:zincin-like metallopeptidase domain-containing protein [Roseibacillus persicicus]|uniref:ArdC family protein n=1 Tax=Roseibacillus persicicus TaxID=454148 RepID=UPI00398A77D3
MKTSTQRKTCRPDIYTQVTERILSHLEQGTVPWHCPHCAKIGFPKNFQSDNEYQGVNILLLALSGFSSPYFLTYLQAKALGGQVRKGEKGTGIIKCGTYEKATGQQSASDTEEKESQTYLKGYTVFNSTQIDGIEFPNLVKPDFTPSQKVAKAKAIVANMPDPPHIEEGNQARTCYRINDDSVAIPDRSFFESEERFYKSLFHELIHSTGTSKRLGRESLLKNRGLAAGSEKIYAKEELVAEIGAAFLCAHAGIVIADHENSAAYLESWLKVFRKKDNTRLIFTAAREAGRAVAWILHKNPAL